MPLDFGEVAVGGSLTKILTVSNYGDSEFVVSDITIDYPDFSAEPTSFTLASGESKEVNVTFDPTELCFVSATLTIESNASNTPSLNVPLTAGHFGWAVELTAPTENETLCGTVDVMGTAQATGLQDWILDYAEGVSPAEDDFVVPPIKYGIAPVDDGLLAKWDTTLNGDGPYTLRIRVNDECGDSKTVTMIVNLECTHAEITAPAENDTLSGTVSVTSTARSARLQDWILDVAPGEEPSDDDFIVPPIKFSQESVDDGVLAEWDTTKRCDGVYTLRLRLTHESGYDEEVRVKVTLDNTHVAITAPTENQLLSGVFKVTGTVTSGVLKEWILDYAPGDAPAEGNYVAIKIGTDVVQDGHLADWNTPADANDDLYTLRLRVIDTCEQTEETTVVVRVDNTPCPAPQVGIVSSEGYEYTGSHLSIEVSGSACEEALLVSAKLLDENDNELCDVTSYVQINAGVISGTVPTGDLGMATTVKLSVIVKDEAGNPSEGKSNELLVDNVLPSVRILNPADGAFFHQKPLLFSGDANDDVGVSRVEFKTQKDLDWVTVEGTAEWAYTYEPPRSEYKYDVQVRAIDLAGNVSVEPNQIYVSYYRFLPTANISSPVDGAEFVSNIISIKGSAIDIDEDLSDFSYTLEYGEGTEPTTWGEILTESGKAVVNDVLGTWDVRDLPDGFYVIRLTVQNSIGTSGPAERRNIRLLRCNTITAPPRNGAYLRGVVSVRGTAEAEEGEEFQSYTVKAKKDESAYQVVYIGTTLVPEEAELCLWDTLEKSGQSRLYPDGNYALRLEVKDSAGTIVDEIHVVVDNTGAVIKNLRIDADGANGDFIRSNADITVSGEAEDISPVSLVSAKLMLDGNLLNDVTDKITIENGVISGELDGYDLTGGYELQLLVIAEDAAGNRNDEANGRSNVLTVDDILPEVVIHNPADMANFHLVPIPISGIANDDESGIASVEIDTGGGRAPAEGTTSWTYSFPPPEIETVYTVTAYAKDNAGNEGASVPIQIKHFPTLPTANICEPIDGSRVSGTVDILGIVDESSFNYDDLNWKVECAPGTNAEEPTILIKERTGEKRIDKECRAVLAQWNTLEEGYYTLFLTVANNQGTVKLRRTSIYVRPAVCGDVNGDGEVTAYDASLVLKSVVGTYDLSPSQQNIADVTGNGAVCALDAAWILQAAVGLRVLTQCPTEGAPGGNKGYQVKN